GEIIIAGSGACSCSSFGFEIPTSTAMNPRTPGREAWAHKPGDRGNYVLDSGGGPDLCVPRLSAHAAGAAPGDSSAGAKGSHSALGESADPRLQRGRRDPAQDREFSRDRLSGGSSGDRRGIRRIE